MAGLFSDDDLPRGDFALRAPCSQCGGSTGRIARKGEQDCVYCDCGRYQYNAPRVETGAKPRTCSNVRALLSGATRARVLLRANAQCELCGVSAANAELHVGHIISIKEGLAEGLTERDLNDDENLCAMCRECNLSLAEQTATVRLAMVLRVRRRSA